MGVLSKHNARFLLITLIIASGIDCLAQENTTKPKPTNYYVRSHESLRNTVWKDSLYRFNDFQDGRVKFITGLSKTYKLNYSLASGEMEFIDINGDSLVLDGTPDLRLVNVGGWIFYHHPRVGYIELLLQMPIALGVRRILSVESREVVGDNGYGQTSFATTSVYSFRGTPSSLNRDYDILYTKTNVFFFIDRQNVPMVATRFSLYKLFPEHKLALRSYLRENRINFRKERDMVALTNYIARFY
jgi:hypothetical protein